MDEGTVNISDIKIDPRRFQFRLGNIAEDGTRGILADVKVYNPMCANIVLVWQDKNRQLFLVDGHERLALAKRMGVQQVWAFILKESEGISAEGAREEGIWVNIANGLYSVSELAVLFKNYDMTLDRLSEKIFKANCEKNLQALTMLNLCDDVFDMAVTGEIPEALAAVIGEYVKSNDLQRILVEKIKKYHLEEITELKEVVSEELIDRKFFDLS